MKFFELEELPFIRPTARVEMTYTTVQFELRALRTQWTSEMLPDLVPAYNLDAEAELTAILNAELFTAFENQIAQAIRENIFEVNTEEEIYARRPINPDYYTTIRISNTENPQGIKYEIIPKDQNGLQFYGLEQMELTNNNKDNLRHKVNQMLDKFNFLQKFDVNEIF